MSPQPLDHPPAAAARDGPAPSRYCLQSGARLLSLFDAESSRRALLQGSSASATAIANAVASGNTQAAATAIADVSLPAPTSQGACCSPPCRRSWLPCPALMTAEPGYPRFATLT